MITVTPISFNQKSKSIPFEKSRKEIINEAPNRELKQIAKDLTGVNSIEFAVDVGIPDLLNYAKKGETEKKQAISILRDAIESEELQATSDKCLFYGIPDIDSGKTDDEGYLGAYEKLTGTRLDINI